jgi:hypothetical protein
MGGRDPLAAYQDYLLDFSTFFHVNTTERLSGGGSRRTASTTRKVVVASSQAAYGDMKYRCCYDLCKRNGLFCKPGRNPGASSRNYAQLKRGNGVCCPFPAVY